MKLSPYPYNVGDQVAGADCFEAPFTGTVTKLLGPYTVLLDDQAYTPTALIDTPPTNKPAVDGGVFA